MAVEGIVAVDEGIDAWRRVGRKVGLIVMRSAWHQQMWLKRIVGFKALRNEGAVPDRRRRAIRERPALNAHVVSARAPTSNSCCRPTESGV
jgi:hypothetical protein